MVFPFKHPLGWFLLLAALGLVGCNDEATTPETLHTEPYRTPPVECNEGKKNTPFGGSYENSLPTMPAFDEIYVLLVDRKNNLPMEYNTLEALIPDGSWLGGIPTTTHDITYSETYLQTVSTAYRADDSKGILTTSSLVFSEAGDSLLYINLAYHFKDDKPERLRVVYYNKGFEPDSCYRLYYFHNDTLVYKGNDHRIHYPALHIDY